MKVMLTKDPAGPRLFAALLVLWVVLAGPAGVPPSASASDDPPEFSGAISQFTLLRPAKKAPFGTLLGKDGEPVDLKQFRGKVLLVNFWATWCAPCRIEMPSLNRLQAAMGGPDFQVVPVSLDRRGAPRVLAYYREHKLANLGVYLDPGSQTSRAFGVPGLPMTFIVDHRGKVVGYLKGHAEWDSKAALALIRYYVRRIPGR